MTGLIWGRLVEQLDLTELATALSDCNSLLTVCVMLMQRKQEPKEVAPEEVVSEEEAAPAPEPVPPPQEPSGPLTLAQVAAANVTEADVPPAEAPVSGT